MATYQGHKNWNHWNVSLWINNDEGLYRLAREARYQHRDANTAAQSVLEALREAGNDKTPDGAPYSISSIRAALVDM